MKKRFTPEDMKYINYVTWPVISEDGQRIAWVNYVGEEENGSFPSQIYYLNRNKKDEKFSLPDNGDSQKQPVFLKDGKRMAYLSDRTGEYQVYIRNLETGEEFQATTLRHGVLRYALTEDESRLVFEATLWPNEVEDGSAFREMNADEKASWEEELDWQPYEITDLTYKMDEWHGMRKGEFSRIGVVNLCAGRLGDASEIGAAGTEKNAWILPCNGMEAVYPSWSPDGEYVAFYGYPYGGAKGRRTELFICRADGSELKRLTTDAGMNPDHAPVFSRDGKTVIGMAYAPLEDWSTVMLPYAIRLADGKGRFLIDEWDEAVCHGVNPMGAGRLEYGDRRRYFCLDKTGRYLYFISGLHGRTGLYRVDIAGSLADWEAKPAKVELVKRGETDLQEFAMNRQGQILTAMSTWTEPAELYLDGERLTDSNSWLQDYELAKVEEVWVKSKDRKADLQYYLVYPVGFEEGTVYPAVLDIKGGPETMYGLAFWHEFQALAAAGMAVIFGNPRGSVGFGRAYCANGVCWEPEAMDDLLQFVDDAASRGWIDRDRIGVTGGSYGGYMTNKLLGRTEVFAAAVTQRCLANTATSYGTGDMGFVSSREIPKNFRMFNYLSNRAKGNIISYIDHFKVPLLILHAYEDYRCGFEQAEQVFVAMKERNPEVPVRMVMFPGENHGMTRTGKLHHQIRHLEEMVNWFVRYLNTENEKDGEKHE